MYENLRFRRQFLLTKAPISDLFQWNCLQVKEYWLYSHPDLEVNLTSESSKSIVVIGEIFDPESPEKGNSEISKDLLRGASDKDEVVSRIRRYVGIYVLIYMDERVVYAQNDPLALREVYYCIHENVVVCGSQPNLIAHFSSPAISATNDQAIVDFYSNHLVASKWIGDETYFCGVNHLLPNHGLDIRRREVFRYWPTERIRRLTLEEAVQRSCKLLQGALEAIAHRHDLMMAVTAGTDSRTLLAASKNIRDRIYYFINNQDMNREHPDIAVPLALFAGIGLEFHVHDVEKDVDPAFRQIFLDNVFLATDRILPTIYNVYYNAQGKRANILGIGEIGRTRYGKQPATMNAYRLAYKLGYKRRSDYAARVSKKLLLELQPISKKYNVNALTLLYWEQMLGNWGTVGNSESDIAIEEINPYDCHLLYETFLGVDEKYTKYKESPCILFREMIHAMWPELLDWPINPAYSIRSRFDGLLIRLGIFGALKELKYRLHYFLHLLNVR